MLQISASVNHRHWLLILAKRTIEEFQIVRLILTVSVKSKDGRMICGAEECWVSTTRRPNGWETKTFSSQHLVYPDSWTSTIRCGQFEYEGLQIWAYQNGLVCRSCAEFFQLKHLEEAHEEHVEKLVRKHFLDIDMVRRRDIDQSNGKIDPES